MFADGMTANQTETKSNPEVDKKLEKAKKMNEEIFKKTHPDEYKKNKDEEKLYKSKMANLTKEVHHLTRSFISKSKKIKKGNKKRAHLLKKLKKKYEDIQ